MGSADDAEDEEKDDEDKACSRTKKAVPNQDQPYYHILMVEPEDGEHDPVQHKLNVPEGNLRLMFAFLHHLPTRIYFSCFLLFKNR